MSFDVLDLYAGEGGAGEGYAQAGARVTGVDLANHVRRYPHAFICTDVLKMDVRFLRRFDLIHASPPCQFGCAVNNDKSKHLNLIPETRLLLQASGRPYVIENVMKVAEAGHLRDWVALTGTMFDDHMVTSAGRRYVLERKRAFETSWGLTAPADPGSQGHPIANIFGGHVRCRDAEHRTGKGTGKTVDFPGEDRPALAAQLMSMPWATMAGMSEAIPPSMTRYIGEQFLRLR